MVTELENGRPQNCGAIPNRRKRLSLLQSIQTVSRVNSVPYSLGTRVSSSWVKVVDGSKKLTTHSHLVP
jgi:hypothetical protein